MSKEAAGALLALLGWTVACSSGGSATGGLERAAAAFREAVVEGDAQRFLALQLPEVREALLEQVRDNDERLRALRAKEGEEAVERVLAEEIGTDWETWERLDDAGRFALLFPSFAPRWFAELGLNPEHLRGARLVRVRVRGDEGEALFDDGRGHRTLVGFVRTDEGWRYQPPDGS